MNFRISSALLMVLFRWIACMGQELTETEDKVNMTGLLSVNCIFPTGEILKDFNESVAEFSQNLTTSSKLIGLPVPGPGFKTGFRVEVSQRKKLKFYSGLTYGHENPSFILMYKKSDVDYQYDEFYRLYNSYSFHELGIPLGVILGSKKGTRLNLALVGKLNLESTGQVTYSNGKVIINGHRDKELSYRLRREKQISLGGIRKIIPEMQASLLFGKSPLLQYQIGVLYSPGKFKTANSQLNNVGVDFGLIFSFNQLFHNLTQRNEN